MANFNEETIRAIWNKAVQVPGANPDIWRKDFAGAWIRRGLYGLKGDYGWEIDHIRPISKGGNNDLDNLNPIHWRNNISKSDNYPKFRTSVTSRLNVNIEEEKLWEVR